MAEEEGRSPSRSPPRSGGGGRRSRSPDRRSPDGRSPVRRSRSKSRSQERRRSRSRSRSRERRRGSRSRSRDRMRRSPSRDRHRRSRSRSRSRGRSGYGHDYGSRRRPSPRPMRERSPPPERGSSLFVAGIPFAAREEDLEEKLDRYGRVVSCRIVRNPQNGQSKGFGFVTMDTDEDAELCVRKLNGSDWQGRRLLVEIAKNPRS
ncbi:serine arginine repetitive matrix 5-like isoform X2 [Micractinium conductrix]|uniref:Serine arginine repetitive matrix 5-like isoform X2 n=1 Tax=Micractinium conductrix TaxID=554055 RepID=A0A2P6VPP2_9CHLO|nr:serine arginine repetitive matrix 5-like isoform X2 [Micractinium conductrix]|eukprot:PSC76068.1 serine arginine repetitive matrix 5-like isoform X2 [Micractinium conductrix]